MPAFGQLPAREVTRLNTTIEFDGKVSSGEWDGIDSLPLVSHWPTYAEKPNGRTLLRIAYDENYLYWSSVCFYDMSQIQEPTFERDAIIHSDISNAV